MDMELFEYCEICLTFRSEDSNLILYKFDHKQSPGYIIVCKDCKNKFNITDRNSDIY